MDDIPFFIVEKENFIFQFIKFECIAIKSFDRDQEIRFGVWNLEATLSFDPP